MTSYGCFECATNKPKGKWIFLPKGKEKLAFCSWRCIADFSERHAETYIPDRPSSNTGVVIAEMVSE